MKIKGEKVILRPKKPSDAENDYRWQTDTELSALDAMPPMTMSFQEFYREYISILKHPYEKRVTFAVETPDGRHIGNCVYYNIDESNHKTEIGIMIGDRDYWDKGYGADTIDTLIDYVFRRYKFERIYLKTLETNLRAQRCFQKCGLTPYSHIQRDGYQFLLMDMSYSRWQELRNQI
ncbi:MAG: GNAT family N-acetyltransferase [Dehalococcoidales bacterium]|nr:GNAT family N-acetyltransferase [Dehalococcoidales bacterium]